MTDELMALLAKATAGSWSIIKQRLERPIADETRHNSIWTDEGRGQPVVALAHTRPANEGDPWVWICSISPEDAAAIVAAVNFCRTELPALIAERDALVKAVDALALALADNLHTWTPEQRALYESATKGCD